MKKHHANFRLLVSALLACVATIPMGCMGQKDAPSSEMVLAIDFGAFDEAQLTSSKDSEAQAATQEQIVAILKDRLHDLKIRNLRVEALDSDRIRIQFGSDTDPEQVSRVATTTGRLGFHLVARPDQTANQFRNIDRHFGGDFLKRLERPVEGSDGALAVPEDQIENVRQQIQEAANAEDLIPGNYAILFGGPREAAGIGQYYPIYLVDKAPIKIGGGSTSAGPIADKRQPGTWGIALAFEPKSAARFGEVTGENIGRTMAIVVDDTVISASVIQSSITSSCMIAAAFKEAEARELAIVLQSGPLPAPVQRVLIDTASGNSP